MTKQFSDIQRANDQVREWNYRHPGWGCPLTGKGCFKSCLFFRKAERKLETVGVAAPGGYIPEATHYVYPPRCVNAQFLRPGEEFVSRIDMLF